MSGLYWEHCYWRAASMAFHWRSGSTTIRCTSCRGLKRGMRMAGMRLTFPALASLWQNGRTEHLFGTLKTALRVTSLPTPITWAFAGAVPLLVQLGTTASAFWRTHAIAGRGGASIRACCRQRGRYDSKAELAGCGGQAAPLAAQPTSASELTKRTL